MIKALLVILAIAVGGGAAAGVYCALPRGEEEVTVQTAATPTPVATALPTPGPGWRCVREEFPDGRESFHAEGASEEAMKIIRSCTYVYDTPCYFYFDGKVERPLPGQAEYCGTARLFEVTPAPTPDWGPLAPNPKAVLSSPPQHRVGDAAALGRSDCPQGWQALVSDTTGMSFCFPSDIGKLTATGEGPFVLPGVGERWEERAEITLFGEKLPAVVTINVIRRAGLAGAYWWDCPYPDMAPFQGLPTKRCIWPEGFEDEFEGVVPWFAEVYHVRKSNSVWVFEAIIWGVKGAPREDISSLEDTISRILNTLSLP